MHGDNIIIIFFKFSMNTIENSEFLIFHHYKEKKKTDREDNVSQLLDQSEDL